MSRLEELVARGFVLLDGAMATRLFALGLPEDQASDSWNLERPEEVLRVHREHLEAGAEVIQTNTFLAKDPACLRAGVELARRAAEAFGAAVAGNLGPLVSNLELADAEAHTRAAVQTLASAGADWISLETLGDSEAGARQVRAAVEASALPVVASVTLSPDVGSPRVHGGEELAQVAGRLASAGAVALGINCSAGHAQVLRALPELLEATSLPVSVKPNAGAPERRGGALVWDCDPEDFAASLLEAARLGAWAVGGCCGTEARHLAAARRALDGWKR